MGEGIGCGLVGPRYRQGRAGHAAAPGSLCWVLQPLGSCRPSTRVARIIAAVIGVTAVMLECHMLPSVSEGEGRFSTKDTQRVRPGLTWMVVSIAPGSQTPPCMSNLKKGGTKSA